MIKSKVLLIYTGGTIGMVANTKTGLLEPSPLHRVLENIPELRNIPVDIEIEHSLDPKDSSDIGPADWIQLGSIICNRYQSYDGFVVLHGTDTMSYTSSALSFMLPNIQKPIIFTGAQLPMGAPRTDARENLITAIEIAGAKNTQGRSIVKEVCLYFEYKLYRANRTTKLDAEHFDAFASLNIPALAEAGIELGFQQEVQNSFPYLKEVKQENILLENLETNILHLRLFPAKPFHYLGEYMETHPPKGLIIESYGSGNTGTNPALFSCLASCQRAKIPVLHITQCLSGSVRSAKYASGEKIAQFGVVQGNDLTLEAAITKMMVVIGMKIDYESTLYHLRMPWRGEMTVV